jgi:tetratricopeptide (TPR) repeat protein
MTRTRRTILAIAAALPLTLALAPAHPAFAEGITRVKGKVVDKDGKPMPKVPLYFHAVDIAKKVGPVRTGKTGEYIIATLDISVAKKWHVIPDLPGYKVVKVTYEIIDSEEEERGKGDQILGSKQEFPDLPFALVGDAGRNVVDFVLAKEADFAAAVLAERKKREGAEKAAAGGTETAAAPEAAATPAEPEPLKPPPGAAEALQKAKQLTDAGRHPEAIEMYNAYLAKDPSGNPAVYYYLGKSLFESGDDDAAERAFKKGLELKADMKGAHFYLGNVYLREDRPAEAAAEYEKEILLTPDSDSVYFNLGQAYAKANQDDKALGAFEKSITINPSKSEGYMLMAAIYEKRKDTAKAEEMYQKVIGIDPKNAAISFFNIGAHAWNENRPKEAAQAFRKAIELDPNYAVAHRELATALMKTQDFPGALKHFEIYLKLNPKAPDAKDVQSTIALLRQ